MVDIIRVADSGFLCINCKLRPQIHNGVVVYSIEAYIPSDYILQHLQVHKRVGHTVPDSLIRSIEDDFACNEN